MLVLPPRLTIEPTLAVRGSSRLFRTRADNTFTLPVCGVSRSVNLSLTVALCLQAALSSGHFPAGSLPEECRTELLGRWLVDAK